MKALITGGGGQAAGALAVTAPAGWAIAVLAHAELDIAGLGRRRLCADPRQALSWPTVCRQ